MNLSNEYKFYKSLLEKNQLINTVSSMGDNIIMQQIGITYKNKKSIIRGMTGQI